MNYRHEWKHEINSLDRLVLINRLSAVMKSDSHSIDGKYCIRSLYFDSLDNKALKEKKDGLDHREKFRLRYYNNNASYIVLEKKSKLGNLTAKQSCAISIEEAQSIVKGNYQWLKDSDRPLCRELYFKMRTEGLLPRTIVDYKRIPFVFPAGNVRVTIDYDIRTGLKDTDFLNPDTQTLSAGDPVIILEVKWDEYLPDIIKDAVTINGRHVCAFSKYEQCRIYG